jgi:hypothetical protein
MANGFDVVPVRTNDESRIVVRVVLRAQTRSTIVFATGRQGRTKKRIHLLVTLGRERQVEMRGVLLLNSADAQGRFTVRTAKLDTEWPFRKNGYPERFERLEEKRLARCIVADSEYDVIKHAVS